MQENWIKKIKEHEKLEKELQKSSTASDPAKLRDLGKKLSDLSPVVEKIREYKENEKQIEENTELIKDPDFAELAKEEIIELENKNKKLEEEIIELLVEKDPDDEKNAIVEIRAGTGGEEAALFAGDLTGMLFRFAENKGYKTEIFNKNESDNGGIKDISFVIKGDNAYGQLKYESGVHRVQRIPKTESKGRLHTSAASIFITPEVEESEFDIPENEIKMETFRSSGPGGQSVNTTDSAVRLTHIPTGVTVSCQDEKSQHKNRARAMSILRSRLAELEKAKKEEEENAERRSAIKRGDRSEKIRTWNWPQDRMTDHRIQKSFFGIKKFLEGDLDEVIEEFKKVEKM